VLPRRATEQRLSDSCLHEASGGKLLAVWSSQNACSCSHMRNSWQSRSRHVQQCVPHNQPTPCIRCSIRSTQSAAGSAGATVWIATSFRPHPSFSSTPSHANAAEFSSCPRMQLQLHTLCALSTTRLVCGNCLTVVAPRHGAAAPHRAVMGIKRRPVERPVEHACPEAPLTPRN
jgi:hypothetical protein